MAETKPLDRWERAGLPVGSRVQFNLPMRLRCFRGTVMRQEEVWDGPDAHPRTQPIISVDGSDREVSGDDVWGLVRIDEEGNPRAAASAQEVSIMKTLRYSPTQLSMFLACPRKWHYAYIGGFKPPQTKNQALGTAIHREIEQYISSGQAPSDPRAVAGLEKLELVPPGNLFVEQEINLDIGPSFEGKERRFIGFIDFLDARDPTHPVVTDHKTTSDLKYGKTDFELIEDIQMNCYAYWALQQYPDATVCTVQHNTIPTRGSPKAVLSKATLSRADVNKRWSYYMDVIDTMDRFRALPIEDVPALGMDNGECERYGGCFQKERCLVRIFQKGSKMSAEDIRNKLNALKGGLKTPANGANGTAKASDDSGAGVKSRLAALKKEMGEEDPATLTSEQASVQPGGNGLARLQALKKKAPAQAPAQADPPQAPENKEPVQAASQPVQPAVQGRQCKYLFLNCVPTQGISATNLEEITAPLLQTIERETGLNWQLHDYRKGVGLLLDGLNTIDLPEAIVVDTTTKLGKDALENLIPRSEVVVVGKL